MFFATSRHIPNFLGSLKRRIKIFYCTYLARPYWFLPSIVNSILICMKGLKVNPVIFMICYFHHRTESKLDKKMSTPVSAGYICIETRLETKYRNVTVYYPCLQEYNETCGFLYTSTCTKFRCVPLVPTIYSIVLFQHFCLAFIHTRFGKSGYVCSHLVFPSSGQPTVVVLNGVLSQ